MTLTVNVQEAKTRLSELLHRVEAGEEIVISRAGKAIVTLQPVAPRVRSLGEPLLRGVPPIDAAEFLEPMPEDELQEWETSHESDPLGQAPAR